MALNYVYNLMMVMGAGMLSLTSREDLLWHLAAYASIIFGFMLRINEIRKKQAITGGLILWNMIATACIVWLFVVSYKAYYNEYGNYFMVWLFLVAFFSSVISENLDKLGNVSIPKIRRFLAKKLYLPDENGEEEI